MEPIDVNLLLCPDNRHDLPCIYLAEPHHPTAHGDSDGNRWMDYLHVRIGNGKR